MFRVRAKNLAAMAQAMALEAFEAPMIAHLHTFAPGPAKAIGDEGIRETIRLGIARARAHGVTNTGLLRYYIELMFVLGSHFDTDPLLPWVDDALRDRATPDQAPRIARLFASERAYFRAIGRVEGEVALPILRGLQETRFMAASVADHSLEEHVSRALRAIDPQRCAYLGAPALHDLARRASAVAAQLQVATPRGTPLVAGLTFLLGHGFAEDPIHPWIRDTLRDPFIEGPSRRVEVLEERISDFIDGLAVYFEERTDVG